MLNLKQLHDHFLRGNITDRRSGKTTAVIYQAIGFMEVLSGTNIYILCCPEDIDLIHNMISLEILKNYHYNSFSFSKRGEIKCINGNKIIIKTFDSYMNRDKMQLNHSPEDHMILFDYRRMTSVNTSTETIFKVMGRTIGEVVAACGYEVNKAFGGIPINIYIN